MEAARGLLFPFHDYKHSALAAVKFEAIGVMSISEPQRLFNFTIRTLQFGAQIQLIPDAVAGGHDGFSGCVGKGFKSRFGDSRAMAFIKFPGKGVENIGVEIDIFFRIGNIVWRKRDALAGVCFISDFCERIQCIPPDAIKQAYGKKARLVRLNRQLGHLI